ncbi:hypothetical protein E2493_06125 [Sphingomonas parva]|uniref:Uncharacterized protein n=1 Tax=Sphingomonas parva TaxID=2555898 RepID=A0A4Y8ZSV7_9SPHN|nr:hypothetical protein [Sphingomonas parva]TFI59100.1 hypothetical protein E2493_06125 [Sphingomonas parva]
MLERERSEMEPSASEDVGATSQDGAGAAAREPRAWRWSLPAGLATVALAAGLVLMPPSNLFSFLKWAGWAYLAAAVIEAAVGMANLRTIEARASLLLAAGGAIAGFILLLATTTRVFRLDHLLLAAIAMRALSAGGVGMLVGAKGRGWILCRGLGEVAVGILLVITVLAVLAAIPFASLSAGFLKSQTGHSDDLAALIAGSLFVAGASQILVGLWAARRRC